MSRNHEKLSVFQKSDELAVLVYRLTARFPADERFGLTSQIRPAAVSVPTNIVEGCARETERDYLRFLDIALGSAECRTCASEVVRMLQKLLTTLRRPGP